MRQIYFPDILGGQLLFRKCLELIKDDSYQFSESLATFIFFMKKTARLTPWFFFLSKKKKFQKFLKMGMSHIQ